MLRWLLGKTDVDKGPGDAGRSPQWSAVRDRFIKANPRCAACGSAKRLEAHHVLPFHVHPELELSPANLVPLCRPCHLSIGHGYDWSAWRPDCRRLASQMLATPVVRK